MFFDDLICLGEVFRLKIFVFMLQHRISGWSWLPWILQQYLITFHVQIGAILLGILFEVWLKAWRARAADEKKTLLGTHHQKPKHLKVILRLQQNRFHSSREHFAPAPLGLNSTNIAFVRCSNPNHLLFWNGCCKVKHVVSRLPLVLYRPVQFSAYDGRCGGYASPRVVLYTKYVC